jgi:sec-independent protein translocase protein TatA
MPFNLGGPELIIVLVIVLIVFGAGKLPNVMRDFGRGVKEFKKAQTEEEIAAEAAKNASASGTSAPPPTTTAPSNGAASGASVAPPAPSPSRPAEPAPRA